MKNYISPDIEIVDIRGYDVITSSVEVETPKVDGGYGEYSQGGIEVDW